LCNLAHVLPAQSGTSGPNSLIQGIVMADVSAADFRRLATTVEELSVQVVALTALMGAMVTKVSVDFERLEDCVQFAANRLRPSRRPLLFAKAALVLEDFEVMQKTLRIETRKIRKMRDREKPRKAPHRGTAASGGKRP